MMDLFYLKVSSKFMKGFVANMVSKKIYKKFGCKVDIQFKDITIDTVNGEVMIHVNGDAKINKTEFERLLEKID